MNINEYKCHFRKSRLDYGIAIKLRLPQVQQLWRIRPQRAVVISVCPEHINGIFDLRQSNTNEPGLCNTTIYIEWLKKVHVISTSGLWATRIYALMKLSDATMHVWSWIKEIFPMHLVAHGTQFAFSKMKNRWLYDSFHSYPFCFLFFP